LKSALKYREANPGKRISSSREWLRYDRHDPNTKSVGYLQRHPSVRALANLCLLLAPSREVHMSRRGVAGVLALPFLGLRPGSAVALPFFGALNDQGYFDDDRSTVKVFEKPNDGEKPFKEMVRVKTQLSEIATLLDKRTMQSDDASDAGVLFQILTLGEGQGFGKIAELLEETTDKLALLEVPEVARARELVTPVSAALEDLRLGLREQSADKPLVAIKAADKALGEYLDIVASKYDLPGMAKKQSKYDFRAEYFGILSCEGIGDERVPNSNACKGDLQK